jgi:hypothetical protein
VTVLIGGPSSDFYPEEYQLFCVKGGRLKIQTFSQSCLEVGFTIIMRLAETLLALCILLFTSPGEAQSETWKGSISSEAEWRQYSGSERDAEFLKFFLSVKTGEVYYLDTKSYRLHLDFWFKEIVHQERNDISVKAFNRNYDQVKPDFILGYLTHYPKLDFWAISFWEGDAITARDVEFTFSQVKKSFFVKDLVFRPDSLRQESLTSTLVRRNITVITNDKIYKNLPFQAFQVGKSVGVLRIISSNVEFDSLVFKPTDIVILSKPYPDISPVAGIITTQFSTPLAHVNLRASAWGIPNAAYKNADTEFLALNGEIVVYSVTEQNLSIRQATDREKQEFRISTTPKKIRIPRANLFTDSLPSLHEIEESDSISFGAKTANLGAIVKVQLNNVHVPDGFGIPFAYYARHLSSHPRLQRQIDELLSDARFKEDILWRRIPLAKLRESIQKERINPNDMARIKDKWRSSLGGKGVFVRSSTNAEDLKDFNGAGLYDTVPNVTTNEGLEAAIKTVWASIWNERAVAEREFAGIDHRGVYPGVLVQIGIPATAAGVLLTTDTWRHERGTFTINAKWGVGIRVVNGTTIPEQVLYDSLNRGTRIISRSSDKTMLVFDSSSGLKEVPTASEEVILTPERAKVLGDTAIKIAPLFIQHPILDIEWVLEGDKVWIVQCRPYVQRSN